MQVNDFTRDLLPILQRAAAEAQTREQIREQIAPLLHPTYSFNAGGSVLRGCADGGAVSALFSGARYNPLGYVTGPGTSRSDSIPAYFPAAQRVAHVSHTEYVLDAETVRNIGVENLDRVRARKGLADGGAVATVTSGAAQGSAPIFNLNLALAVNLAVGEGTSVQVLSAALATPTGERMMIGKVRAHIRDNPSAIPADIELAQMKQKGRR